MSSATLLSNERLWQTLISRVKSARHVDAAIAYIGRGGAKLLPLSRGDSLVVDMSLATVRGGATDPSEIEKLIRRGVKVFTRRHLHSKLIVADHFVIAGSANVSNRSYRLLDEAAILTNDTVAIRRAREFINRICTEPVGPIYLDECKRAYVAPHFASSDATGSRQSRAKHAKLWIVALRHGFSIPEGEVPRYRRGEAKAKKLVKDAEGSKMENFFWPSRPRMANELELGDWIIQVVKHTDDTVVVHPPARLLLVDSYVRDRKSGKERYVFHLELPKRGETMDWNKFRRTAKAVLKTELARRTKPVRDADSADAFLRLWTAAGRVSRS